MSWYNQAPDPYLANMEERWAAEDAANAPVNINDKKPKVLGATALPKTGSKFEATGKGTGTKLVNYNQSALFKDHRLKLVADRKYVTEYEEMLAKEYLLALRAQLRGKGRTTIGGKRRRYTSIGYASGELYKAIKTNTKVTLERDLNSGRVYYSYKLNHDYTDAAKNSYNNVNYGDFLNYTRPRKRKRLHHKAILKWMDSKPTGTFKALDKTGKGIKTIKQERVSIAVRIAAKISGNTLPAVAKYWSNFDKNPSLTKDFRKRTKKEGKRLRKKIRDSIMYNLGK